MDTSNMILTVHRRDASGIPRPILSVIDASAVSKAMGAIADACGMDGGRARRIRRKRHTDALCAEQ